MDFWREDAMSLNYLCLHPDVRQDMPGAGECTTNDNQPTSFPDDCLSAVDILAGRSPDSNPVRVRGAGCANDNGPLWITVKLEDNEEGISGPNGGGDVPRQVVGRIFQKKSATRKTSRRSRKSSRFAELNDYYPTESKSDLVECMSLQICTATAM